ncbi:hypothetical protein KIPB_014714 [Kipferlia bialata]|uniref:Uncharacterized protein n=1 Tax=Kipferlia bialata TaxID=797122 RepID=A0A391P2U7_9EUKA|nr:hypothetical protein KIPB_014714 [Kipferlia bialata]|eukprot:g14714.t1
MSADNSTWSPYHKSRVKYVSSPSSQANGRRDPYPRDDRPAPPTRAAPVSSVSGHVPPSSQLNASVLPYNSAEIAELIDR